MITNILTDLIEAGYTITITSDALYAFNVTIAHNNLVVFIRNGDKLENLLTIAWEYYQRQKLLEV